ncbi:MAG: family 16 glycoside hydrolase [Planctomycetales bacterium]
MLVATGRFGFAIVVLSLGAVLSARSGNAAEPQVELLWPQGAPGAAGAEDRDKPSLTIWKPAADKANGCAVVICPGGGYGHLAVDHEGKQVAEWLNSLGVTACMLKYRLAPHYKHPAPLHDAQRALRTVRARGKEWGVDPQRVGILGFSAGGHLASTAATHFDEGAADASDLIDRHSARPSFAVLCYPVISFTTPYTHVGSRNNLLGKDADQKLMESLSNELQVTDKTPPTFLFHTGEDTGVPPENSILFYMALRKAKVPAELHIYEKGGHGLGLAAKEPGLSTWPGRCADWMAGRGLLEKPKLVADDPAQVTDPDFLVQGEYAGEIKTDGGALKLGVQVIARGRGKFHAVGYVGGLPGDGWNGQEKHEADGETKNGVTAFAGSEALASIRNGELSIVGQGESALGKLKRVVRTSPTLGEKPPEGAIVLFDGKSPDAFDGGKMSEDGLLLPGVTSRKKFQSGRLHLEFRTPYQPQDQGQARGNSGCYLQGRYEVQILDSFGLAGKDNECGGIYSVRDPSLNMCFPPLAWQTYDIDFVAATYGADGKVTRPARITVRHNGVVIHNDLELPHRTTTAAPVPVGPEPGPLYLQDHGNPVRFRNVWFVEKP